MNCQTNVINFSIPVASVTYVYDTYYNTTVTAYNSVNQALGVASAANDLNGDGVLNVVDAQIVINAVVNGSCVVP